MQKVSCSPRAASPRPRTGAEYSEAAVGLPTARVRDLVSPIGPTLWGTQSLEEAAQRLSASGGAVVVLNLSSRPVGLITESDLDLIAKQEPETWKRKRCACLMRSSPVHLQMGDSLEDIITCYQPGQIRPLLVFDATEAVGIVYPNTVFQWCASHYPAALEALRNPTHRGASSDRSASCTGSGTRQE